MKWSDLCYFYNLLFRIIAGSVLVSLGCSSWPADRTVKGTERERARLLSPINTGHSRESWAKVGLLLLLLLFLPTTSTTTDIFLTIEWNYLYWVRLLPCRVTTQTRSTSNIRGCSDSAWFKLKFSFSEILCVFFVCQFIQYKQPGTNSLQTWRWSLLLKAPCNALKWRNEEISSEIMIHDFDSWKARVHHIAILILFLWINYIAFISLFY